MDRNEALAFPGGAAGEFGDIDDPELMRAIEESYRLQAGGHGLTQEELEEQELARAIELSQREEEERLRRESGGDAAPSPTSMAVPDLGPATAAGPPIHGPPPPSSTGANQNSRNPPDGMDFEEEAMLHNTEGDLTPQGHAPGHDGDDITDAHLARAIEESYLAQTEMGRQFFAEEAMAEALRISKLEEESRQRAALKQQQEAELQESIMMDQVREQEEKRRRLEEEEQRALEASRAQEEARRKVEEEERLKEEEELKRSRVPPEPPAGEPGRVDLQIRTPDGRRLRRAFRSTDLVMHVYDYIDVEGILGEAMRGQPYKLVSTMPRKEYEDRTKSLQAAGLSGQCQLLIERNESA